MPSGMIGLGHFPYPESKPFLLKITRMAFVYSNCLAILCIDSVKPWFNVILFFEVAATSRVAVYYGNCQLVIIFRSRLMKPTINEGTKYSYC